MPDTGRSGALPLGGVPLNTFAFWGLALAGTGVLTLSAKLQVPFWPVPMTLQSLAVLVIGLTCGLRLGTAMLALYLLQGAAGLPVFAGVGAGPAYLMGPTGGFLGGFLVAGVMVGWLGEHGWRRHLGLSLAAMVLGHVVIFACGLAWMLASMDPASAVAAGLTPFLIGTLVKIALGAALVQAGQQVLAAGR